MNGLFDRLTDRIDVQSADSGFVLPRKLTRYESENIYDDSNGYQEVNEQHVAHKNEIKTEQVTQQSAFDSRDSEILKDIKVSNDKTDKTVGYSPETQYLSNKGRADRTFKKSVEGNSASKIKQVLGHAELLVDDASNTVDFKKLNPSDVDIVNHTNSHDGELNDDAIIENKKVNIHLHEASFLKRNNHEKVDVNQYIMPEPENRAAMEETLSNLAYNENTDTLVSEVINHVHVKIGRIDVRSQPLPIQKPAAVSSGPTRKDCSVTNYLGWRGK